MGGKDAAHPAVFVYYVRDSPRYGGVGEAIWRAARQPQARRRGVVAARVDLRARPLAKAKASLPSVQKAAGGSPRSSGCSSEASLRHELDKRAFLLGDLGAERFDLSSLPPNRRAWLAQTGRQQTNQALARMAPERRYPVLLCFCVEALERVTDDAIEIYDRTLGGADRAAQRKREDDARLLQARRGRP